MTTARAGDPAPPGREGGLRAEVAARRSRERARILSPLGSRRSRRAGGLLVLGLLLLAGALLSIAVGAKSIGLGTVVDALRSYDPSLEDHVIVRDLRVPRTLIGLAVGCALGPRAR